MVQLQLAAILHLFRKKSAHCRTAASQDKAAAQERRTCTIILRNWHHHPRFSIVAIGTFCSFKYPIIFFLTLFQGPSFALNRCLTVKMHLCAKPWRPLLSTAHNCVEQRAKQPPPRPTLLFSSLLIPPSTTTTTGYCSVAQRGYGCKETCRGRPGTKMQTIGK